MFVFFLSIVLPFVLSRIFCLQKIAMATVTRREANLVNNAAQLFGIPTRGMQYKHAQPNGSVKSVAVKSKSNTRLEKSSKRSQCASDCFQLCLTPVLQAYVEVVTAKYGYVLNPDDPPQPWAFSIEPTTGYLQIPQSAAASLGFDVSPPELENGMIIANWISSVPPFDPAPVNNLPAEITSALYTFVGLADDVYPFWLLKPLNYLSNATKEWQPADWAFIQQGPYRGVRRIQFIDYATSIAWMEDPAFEDIEKVCCDFCNPKIVKRCGPQRWYIKWGDLKCDDGGCSSSDSDSC